MRDKLFGLLVCPSCQLPFELREFARAGDQVTDGVLACRCGATYPIVSDIPRIFRGAWREHAEWQTRYASELAPFAAAIAADQPIERRDKKIKTKESFGYQWTNFSAMSVEFEYNFLKYVEPIEPSFFPNKLGLDAGCGFGRHIYYAARYGAEMVGIDYSDAIESTQKNTAGLTNVHLVQADIYNLPFRPGTFDFVYSLGVLHHLPEPLNAYLALQRVVRTGGLLAVWLYSKTRRHMNAALELVRRVTPSLPFPLLKAFCWLAAVIDWCLFTYPYKILAKTPLRGFLDRIVFDRVKVYAIYPFHVTYADWFDRLSPPIRFYYNEPDLVKWAEAAHLGEVVITPTGKYGWRLQGRVERDSQ